MKGLQSYFGVSEKRGEEIIEQVTNCFLLALKNGAMKDVNMVKFVAAQNAKDLLEMADPKELVLLGILIEQAYNAALNKPKKGFFGAIK